MNMISRVNMDRLAGILMLNKDFRQDFFEDKVRAIRNYQRYQHQFSTKPIEFDEEELSLILELPASMENFISALEKLLTARGLVVYCGR